VRREAQPGIVVRLDVEFVEDEPRRWRQAVEMSSRVAASVEQGKRLPKRWGTPL